MRAHTYPRTRHVATPHLHPCWACRGSLPLLMPRLSPPLSRRPRRPPLPPSVVRLPVARAQAPSGARHARRSARSPSAMYSRASFAMAHSRTSPACGPYSGPCGCVSWRCSEARRRCAVARPARRWCVRSRARAWGVAAVWEGAPRRSRRRRRVPAPPRHPPAAVAVAVACAGRPRLVVASAAAAVVGSVAVVWRRHRPTQTTPPRSSGRRAPDTGCRRAPDRDTGCRLAQHLGAHATPPSLYTQSL